METDQVAEFGCRLTALRLEIVVPSSEGGMPIVCLEIHVKGFASRRCNWFGKMATHHMSGQGSGNVHPYGYGRSVKNNGKINTSDIWCMDTSIITTSKDIFKIGWRAE